MSLSKLEEIKCPCGEVFEAELWNAINAVEDPDLKEALLCGEVNVVCCPACGELFYAEHFLVYHDSVNELIAFVYPTSFAEQATYCEAKMKEDFQRAMKEMIPGERFDYKPVLLFGLDALVDLLREEAEENDEVAILEYIAASSGLSLVRLHPFLARPLQLPKVLPLLPGGGSDVRGQILAGLRVLLEHNEHLSRYRKALELIDGNPRWALDQNIIKDTSR